jgi:hypothetical protein
MTSGMKRDEYEVEQYYRNHRNQFVIDVSDVERKKDL